MKFITLLAILTSTFAFAFADQLQSTSPKTKTSVQEIVKEGSSARKKKVEMCHDCGKPEVQCDCQGDEHRKKKE